MTLRLAVVFGVGALFFGGGCATSRGAVGDVEEGLASYYHDSLAGNRTASGERYDPSASTCAHRTLPFGTRVRVTVVATGRSAECRINDRGPFVRGRVIDLSRAVARRLGLTQRGVGRVRVVVVRRAKPREVAAAAHQMTWR